VIYYFNSFDLGFQFEHCLADFTFLLFYSVELTMLI